MRIATFVLALILSAASLWGDVQLALEEVARGLRQPVFLTHAGDQSGRLFLVEQEGRIRICCREPLEVFLDLTDRVEGGGEKGLLGLAFHPRFSQNGRFFVNYTTRREGFLTTVVSEFRVSGQNPNRADLQERVLLEIRQPFANHNGGMLAFGPDGFLYIGTGDGGSGGDPLGNAQNLGNLLGKILRIDVDGDLPFALPPDNPFLGVAAARGEIYAYGLRNPWRFSFDRLCGRLFAGDVGQNRWEEVDLIRAGGNYGWNRMEGNHCFPPGSSCSPEGLVPPIAEYDHTQGASVTGGYVYRGRQQTELWGAYLFADFVSGRIWALQERPDGSWRRKELLDTDLLISSFGEDEEGELYVLDYGGGVVYRLRFLWRGLFAQVGDGSSTVGRLLTHLILVNPGAESVRATVRFLNKDGSPRQIAANGELASRFEVTVEGHSAFLLRTDGSSDPLYSGWAEAVAEAPLEGSALFLLEGAGGHPVAEAGIASSDLSKRHTAFAERRPSAGLNTAVALVNPHPQRTAQVTFRLLLPEQSPLSVREIQFELPPGGQLARFLDELLPGEEVEGVVEIVATEPVAATLLRTLQGIHSASLPLASQRTGDPAL